MFKREKRSSNNRKVNRRTDSDGFYENKSDRHFRGMKTYNSKTKKIEVIQIMLLVNCQVNTCHMELHMISIKEKVIIIKD